MFGWRATLGVLLVAILATGVARAQSGPERVRAAEAHYRSAEFSEALDALRAAETGDDLGAEDLVTLLRVRALVCFANSDRDGMRQAFRHLATVAPDAGPGDVPPPVQAAYDEARADASALALEVDVEDVPGGVQVSGRVRGDDAGLVREVRVAVRADGDWREAEAGPVMVPAASGATVEYAVSAIGPGGAAIRTEGTRDAPLTHTSEGAAAPDAPTDDGGDLDPVVIGVVVGASVLAVAIAIVVGVLVATDSQSAPVQLAGPRLEF